ncbi:MAG: hypothetical protein K2I64_06955 [Muribaculaceae bacterium]|nr:hypothetical protein [Muribaculaceae bacterium]
MDGKSIQQYFQLEVQTILDAFKKFETLIPSPKGAGSHHNQEDGRFIEALLRDSLSRLLPKNLEVVSGFIVRPAVKTDKNGRNRKSDEDCHSTQLDIIVYDRAKYPIFMQFGETVVVPPEGVIAIISVKKTLRKKNIVEELDALRNAARICMKGNEFLRPPFLALVSIKHDLSVKKIADTLWLEMDKAYGRPDLGLAFDEMVGFIGALDSWSVFKTRPEKKKTEAKYLYFDHLALGSGNEHLGLQFLLTGILSVFYDKSRSEGTLRPGFTGFSGSTNGCHGIKMIKYDRKPLIF